MQRLLVALLAALDAAIAAAVGVAAMLAPLTVLWMLAFGLSADWGSLWGTSAALWQFAHAVPMQVVIPDDIVVAVGIPAEAARFTLSLPPLIVLLFTVLFAARSGRRAAAAGAWGVGVAAGAAAFTALASVVAVTGQADAVRTPLWAAILLPAAAYLAGLLAGAVRHAWSEGDGGLVDRVHDIVDGWGDWAPVPAEAVRGAAVAVVALTGAGAVAVAVAVVLRGGEVIALFEAARVDVLGGAMLTLGHLAYLPTLIVWAVAWLAGPGFAVGAGTSVSPAGTQLGVVPGIPVLGLLPEHSSIWMLVCLIVPIGAGALAGWMIRSRLVWEGAAAGLGPRAAIAVGIAGLTAGVAALAAALASGSIGPGRLAEAGPAAGPVALAVGIEVLIGAAILLLSPRHRDELAEERTDRWNAEMSGLTTPVD
ncbi:MULTISPECIES: cell division protein PerM [Microbacterium]|uniref:cell division protein PerM n=1 Tax=Microbacterium TaxID=33882 RepID=UPI00217D0CFD|nr:MULTISPECIES: DUF6350 family protein [Microbacterium]UWF77952.1 hypothetical protein JSY13_02535 [Microbacterium neungamense]WCM56129.1 hypothetical protein JRG78_02580 [Microbacterium sp. EF45047]